MTMNALIWIGAAIVLIVGTAVLAVLVQAWRERHGKVE